MYTFVFRSVRKTGTFRVRTPHIDTVNLFLQFVIPCQTQVRPYFYQVPTGLFLVSGLGPSLRWTLSLPAWDYVLSTQRPVVKRFGTDHITSYGKNRGYMCRFWTPIMNNVFSRDSGFLYFVEWIRVCGLFDVSTLDFG